MGAALNNMSSEVSVSLSVSVPGGRKYLEVVGDEGAHLGFQKPPARTQRSSGRKADSRHVSAHIRIHRNHTDFRLADTLLIIISAGKVRRIDCAGLKTDKPGTSFGK